MTPTEDRKRCGWCGHGWADHWHGDGCQTDTGAGQSCGCTETAPDPNPADVARNGSRAERLRLPLARQVVEAVAVENGVCIRPIPMRRTDLTTGETEVVPAPCGATLASKCPPCAERARKLRIAQCRTGWHLSDEPIPDPDPATDDQRTLAALRADLEAARAQAEAECDLDQVADLDDAIGEVNDALTDLGVRGKAAPDNRDRPRRARSTRRRQDAPDLPRLPVEKRTVGRTFTAPDGKTWRPSLFLTLTCDSYGRVGSDGTPVDPDTYDYQQAARDAIHFPKLVDRFWQNLRRTVGWDVQYFATLEPQRRLAPHLHAAVRGTIPRVLLRQVAAATYHQVWWPTCDQIVYPDDRPPVWDDQAAGYVDPATGDPLPAWDDALDSLDAAPETAACPKEDEGKPRDGKKIGPYRGAGPKVRSNPQRVIRQAEQQPNDAQTAEHCRESGTPNPLHVVRFGAQIRADGVVAGNRNADRLVGYLTKYLTKTLDTCHTPTTDAQRAHVDRLAAALRYEPCSPTCANWLRYGVQPKNARPGLAPGRCKGKAHRRETLGFGGRRVLVSRKWSGKTLSDHKADRKVYVRELLSTLGADDPAGDPTRHVWQLLRPGDPATPRREHLLLRAVAQRSAWRAQLDLARGSPGAGALSATTSPTNAA